MASGDIAGGRRCHLVDQGLGTAAPQGQRLGKGSQEPLPFCLNPSMGSVPSWGKRSRQRRGGEEASEGSVEHSRGVHWRRPGAHVLVQGSRAGQGGLDQLCLRLCTHRGIVPVHSVMTTTRSPGGLTLQGAFSPEEGGSLTPWAGRRPRAGLSQVLFLVLPSL